MNQEYRELLGALRKRGWKVELRDQPKSLPKGVQSRYPWLPAELREVTEETDKVVSPDEKAWLISTALIEMHGCLFKHMAWRPS